MEQRLRSSLWTRWCAQLTCPQICPATGSSQTATHQGWWKLQASDSERKGETIKPCTVVLQAPVLADLCRVNKAPLKVADLQQLMPNPAEMRSHLKKSFLLSGNPFMMLPLDYCSSQPLFASRETEAKTISTLMFKPCWEVNEIQTAWTICEKI